MRKAKDIARSAVGKDNRPHDYFRQRVYWRPFGAKWYLAILMAVVSVSIYLYFGSSQRAFMNGPLSTPHANLKCEACHRESFASVSDSACAACHKKTIEVEKSDRAVHHPFDKVEMSRCTFCHAEHTGDIPFVAINDQSCVRCHWRIPQDTGRRVTKLAAKGGNHAEFKLWRKGPAADPGKIKFSHDLHLEHGGVLTTAKGDSETRKRMACKDCHDLDAEGRYMLPINFEKHCGYCHAHQLHRMGFEEVPHEAPDMIRAFLFRYYNSHPPKTGTAPEELAALPDRRRWLDETSIEKAILDRVRGEESSLYGHERLEGYSRCEQCHFAVQGVTSEVAGLAPLPTIEKPNLPRRWFPSSAFSHRAHYSSKITCEYCHSMNDGPPETRALGQVESASATDVLVPHLENCTECHTPGKESNHCTFCHTFHPEPKEKSKAEQPASAGAGGASKPWASSVADARKEGRP